jgi:serine/threonine protein kinase
VVGLLCFFQLKASYLFQPDPDLFVSSTEMRSWLSEQHEFIQSDETFSERQLKPSELLFDPANILFLEERLKNEYATLRYIRENTTIPVPQVLSFGYENGSLKLVTTYITSKLLEDFDDEQRDTAIRAVDEQMERHIVPELQKLRHRSIGSIDRDLLAFPPNPVMYATMQASWRRITSEGLDFVFCHNDLSGHNILLDPESCEILGILDWEYAGFFPSWFERKLWRRKYNEGSEDEEKVYKGCGRVL